MGRSVNTKIIREAIEKRGESGKAKLSVDARTSVSMIEKMLTQNRVPGRYKDQHDIAAACGVTVEELFPRDARAAS